MPVPQNKQELVSEIETNYAKLIADLETIPVELTSNKELEGHAKGTLMSVSDLVAYLVGWGELVLKWNRKKAAGELVDFPETGYKWNELGRLAQKFYADFDGLGYADLLIALEKTKVEILQIIDVDSNQALYHEPWCDKWPKGKMIQLNTSSPYKNARARVRKWKRAKSF